MTFPFPKVGYVIVASRVYLNIINSPERGEFSRKNWWIWACSQMKSTCGTCGFPNGSKWFFFLLWGEIKSLANHLNLPHHVIYFFEEMMPVVFHQFVLSLEDPVAHVSFDISSQILAGSRWSQTGRHLSGPWGTPPEIWRNVRWKIVLWRFRSFPFEMVPC